jgi:hypothetical protein
MLLFQKRFLAGLVDGSITLTFRQWPTARVKVGGRYRVHPIGVVEVSGVDRTRVGEITEAEARRAGFSDRAELLAYLKPAAKGPFGPRTELFRIELRHAGDGDWVAGSRDDKLSTDDIAEIDARLARLDQQRPWTRDTLTLIAKHPRTAAAELAAQLGREKLSFKADVVKLKKLGLTQSLEVGYELSPRGAAYWKVAGRRRKKPRG